MEESRRTTRKIVGSRKSETIKNIRDGRNKPAESRITKSVNRLTSTI